ncbi:GNAT family N-acetyltransferase [Anaeromicrobium sediminis]|uniref:GNAT family N-acetyltransferase n=1 Tax=Anaeromicrobium sediminis TaxID=1478221 RepID=A0A267MN48_9FIRM|nr:GNAT family N-acetyltransferase [Anaeromicrobium sediminis]PAB60348.1 GNAT family N-acetyltransferase [Anaeromicrobium sediminis]
MEFIFTTDLPEKEELYNLYDHLGWNGFLKLSSEQLLKTMKNSYYSVYVYCKDDLIGTGRIVSDGIINAYLCGVGVRSEYRNNGVATKIIGMLVEYCQENNLHIQFFCEPHLVPFYNKMDFEKFAIGMRLKES